MNRKRKIAIIASSRATYGHKQRLIGLIDRSRRLRLQLIVTGMHLLEEYGYTIQQIKADGYHIVAKIEMAIGGDTPSSSAKSFGVEMQNLAQVFSMINPDLVLVTGDRLEMFAAAITAAYMNLPIAHIQGGDVSGHIDDSARHAITKLSHIHFATCKDSAKRIKHLGEEKWRIFNVGAPQLDEIVQTNKLHIPELEKIFQLNLRQPTLLVIQHPVLVEIRESYQQMKELMEAVKALKLQSIIIYPNIDAGGEKIIRAIKEYEGLPFIRAHKNINRQTFISLLNVISAIVGNSSCGIIEAPSFKLPAINIGSRQRGRMQANNVINLVSYDRNLIKEAIKQALFDKKFRKQLRYCKNPYGDGHSSKRIVKILENIKLDKRLLDKRMTY